MINKILVSIAILICALSQVAAKPKIVSSITPVASIVAMLTMDSAEIVSINISGGCPSHYHIKPSDGDKIIDADIFIYIDDSFDGFAKKLSEKTNGRVIKISDFQKIDFINENGVQNWHFWLDLDNVLVFQKEIAKIIIESFPSLKEVILSNLDNAEAKIKNLLVLKKQKLGNLKELLLVQDSLEHFFKGTDIIKLYRKNSLSLKDYHNLEIVLKEKNPKCIIADISQNIEVYKKFNKKIIQLDSENWSIRNDNMSNSYELFYTKYLKMINELKNCT